MFYQPYESPIGNINIYSSHSHLLSIAFENKLSCEEDMHERGIIDFNTASNLENKLLVKAKTWLDCYFNQKKWDDSIVKYLYLKDFTSNYQKIFVAIVNINFGQVSTYGELSSILSISPRVVGNACASNKFPLFIPCHRVIAKNKKSVLNYSASKNYHMSGSEIKQYLLQHESK